MNIPECYKTTEKWITQVCKALNWKVECKFDDEYFWIIIEDVKYFIAASDDVYHLYVVIQYPETRHDDREIIQECFSRPESLIDALLDVHWNLQKSLALQSIEMEAEEFYSDVDE